jgi:hypothetical protein
MTPVKIKVNPLIDISAVRNVENKLLMFSQANRMILITGVKVTTETETYGRKKNKTRQVKYLQCIIYGWNGDGEFVGTFDEDVSRRYLENYNLMNMRKTYMEFEKQYLAMSAKEEQLNTPDFVKAVPQ